MSARKKLGELLVEAGFIDGYQLQSALGHQRQWGGRLGRILIDHGFLSEAHLVKVLARHVGVAVIDLDQHRVHPRVIGLLDRKLVERFGVLAVGLKSEPRGEVLYLAMGDPTNLEAIDAVQFNTGTRVEPLLAGEIAIERAIRRHYDGEQPLQASAPVDYQGQFIGNEFDLEEIGEEEDEGDVPVVTGAILAPGFGDTAQAAQVPAALTTPPMHSVSPAVAAPGLPPPTDDGLLALDVPAALAAPETSTAPVPPTTPGPPAPATGRDVLFGSPNSFLGSDDEPTPASPPVGHIAPTPRAAWDLTVPPTAGALTAGLGQPAPAGPQATPTAAMSPATGVPATPLEPPPLGPPPGVLAEAAAEPLPDAWSAEPANAQTGPAPLQEAPIAGWSADAAEPAPANAPQPGAPPGSDLAESWAFAVDFDPAPSPQAARVADLVPEPEDAAPPEDHPRVATFADLEAGSRAADVSSSLAEPPAGTAGVERIAPQAPLSAADIAALEGGTIDATTAAAAADVPEVLSGASPAAPPAQCLGLPSRAWAKAPQADDPARLAGIPQDSPPPPVLDSAAASDAAAADEPAAWPAAAPSPAEGLPPQGAVSWEAALEQPMLVPRRSEPLEVPAHRRMFEVRESQPVQPEPQVEVTQAYRPAVSPAAPSEEVAGFAPWAAFALGAPAPLDTAPIEVPSAEGAAPAETTPAAPAPGLDAPEPPEGPEARDDESAESPAPEASPLDSGSRFAVAGTLTELPASEVGTPLETDDAPAEPSWADAFEAPPPEVPPPGVPLPEVRPPEVPLPEADAGLEAAYTDAPPTEPGSSLEADEALVAPWPAAPTDLGEPTAPRLEAEVDLTGERLEELSLEPLPGEDSWGEDSWGDAAVDAPALPSPFDDPFAETELPPLSADADAWGDPGLRADVLPPLELPEAPADAPAAVPTPTLITRLSPDELKALARRLLDKGALTADDIEAARKREDG